MSIDSAHRERFIAEAKEHLAAMSSELIALERGEGTPEEHLEQLLRFAHGVKGGAGFTGHLRIQKIAHLVESAFEDLRDKRLSPTGQVIDVLLSAVDRLMTLIDDVDHSEEADVSDCLARLNQLTVSGQIETAGRLASPGQVSSTAEPSEFPLSEHILKSWHRAGFLYGVKMDWFQCESENGIAPLEAARRLEAAGTVLDSRLDLGEAGIIQGLGSGPLWYRAILASTHGPEEFSQRLDIPCAAIVRLQRVENAPRSADRPQPTAGENRAARPTAPVSPGAGGSLRIPISLIDRMMSLAGELVLVRNQAVRSFRARPGDVVKDSIADSEPEAVLGSNSGSDVYARQLLRRLDSVTSELQDAALRMRMQPVGTLFDRFPRFVRDIARQLNKQMEIEISGSEVELDKTIIEALSDPLMHLVRNCCDHGIEETDDRVRMGKPATGRIVLSAFQQQGRILIQIRDDGRGLNREAIKRKALEGGIRQASELDSFTDRQIYDLILMSGFSTASRVTDLSGRGVGMDVVKTNLEQIGGILEIDSAAGQGTTFTLSLPLTLAIVPCLLLQNGDRRYVLPLRDVEEIVLLDPDNGRAQIERAHDEEVVRLHGRLLPVVRLGGILSRPGRSSLSGSNDTVGVVEAACTNGERGYVAVLKLGSQRFGLMIEDLLGSEDIVVSPLHPLLRPLAIYAGSTILGDGKVALILSAEGLARSGDVGRRPVRQESPRLAADQSEGDSQTLLVFRYGAAELLVFPLGGVRRVIKIDPERITRAGSKELINIDGAAVNIIRLDQLLNLSACPDRAEFFLIIPRYREMSVGFLASSIFDTPTMPVKIDIKGYQAMGVLGSIIVRDQIALFLSIDQLLAMWSQLNGASPPALPVDSRRRVLVVDDTQFFRQLIRTHLEEAGYEVVVADHGGEGLERIRESSFDLIVSDIEMPVMDGFTLARQVRENARTAAIPMLAVTTLNDQESRDQAMVSGFDAYEVKLDRQQFLSRVAELLKRGRVSAMTTSSGE